MITGNIPKILLVDPAQSITGNISPGNPPETFDILSTSSLREAMLLIETERPDLIILDFTLPDGESLEICKMLSDHSRYPHNPPVYIFTACDSLENKFSCFISGAKRFFCVPRETPNLIESINSFVRAHARNHSPQSSRDMSSHKQLFSI